MPQYLPLSMSIYSFLFFEDRIAKGEDAVLTKERTIKLAVTSGTTGPGSMLPRVQSQENRFFIALAAFTNAMFNAYPKVCWNAGDTVLHWQCVTPVCLPYPQASFLSLACSVYQVVGLMHHTQWIHYITPCGFWWGASHLTSFLQHSEHPDSPVRQLSGDKAGGWGSEGRGLGE